VTAGADALSYLLSAGGAIVIITFTAVWLAVAPTSRHARRTLAIVVISLAFLSIYGIQYLVARLLIWPLTPFDPSRADSSRRTAVVVLGSGSVNTLDWDGQTRSYVDRTAAIRVTEAVRIFKILNPAFVVSSGGEPHTGRTGAPTGETMKDALLSAGVPAGRILVETQSKTTRDEALVVAPLVEAHGVTQVILVTSGVHMRRSLGAFRAVGIRAIPAIARELEPDPPLGFILLPTKEGLGQASENAHETAGLIYYWLRGWWKR
jgi:uncharacterized SAM-binding protein YcdF (DUF218 family)